MSARPSIRVIVVAVAAVTLIGQLGCSKDSDTTKTKATPTAEATSDSALLALKFHHDK